MQHKKSAESKQSKTGGQMSSDTSPNKVRIILYTNKLLILDIQYFSLTRVHQKWLTFCIKSQIRRKNASYKRQRKQSFPLLLPLRMTYRISKSIFFLIVAT